MITFVYKFFYQSLNMVNTVLITGANGLIGYNIALEFLKRGHCVFLNYHNNKKRINELCEQYPKHAIKIKANIKNIDEVQSMINFINGL